MDAPVTGSAYLRLIAVGALIGVPAAVVAAAFISLVRLLSRSGGRTPRGRSATTCRPGTSSCSCPATAATSR